MCVYLVYYSLQTLALFFFLGGNIFLDFLPVSECSGSFLSPANQKTGGKIYNEKIVPTS